MVSDVGITSFKLVTAKGCQLAAPSVKAATRLCISDTTMGHTHNTPHKLITAKGCQQEAPATGVSSGSLPFTCNSNLGPLLKKKKKKSVSTSWAIFSFTICMPLLFPRCAVNILPTSKEVSVLVYFLYYVMFLLNLLID